MPLILEDKNSWRFARNEFINTIPFFFQTDDIGSCKGDSGAYIKLIDI